MARDWRENMTSNMTGREIIHYISHFDLDTPVQFLDDEGYLHDVTDYSNDNYLGNGKYNEHPKSIVFQTVGKEKMLVVKDGHSNYTSQDFKSENDYVRILHGKDAGKVGRVLAIPASEGGRGLYMFPGQVAVFLENGAETFYADALEKITEETYNKTLKLQKELREKHE